MHDHHRDPASTLSYDAARASDRRVSRLAVAAVPAGILCCPCLLSALLQPVTDNLPRALVDAGVFTWLLRWGVLTLMLTLTAVPLAAVVRVGTSRGRRSGMDVAVAGLTLALLWWLLLVLFKLFFRGWGAAAG